MERIDIGWNEHNISQIDRPSWWDEDIFPDHEPEDEGEYE